MNIGREKQDKVTKSSGAKKEIKLPFGETPKEVKPPLTKEQEKEVLSIPEKKDNTIYSEPGVDGMFEEEKQHAASKELGKIISNPNGRVEIIDKRGKDKNVFEDFDDRDSEQAAKELSKGVLSEEYVYEKVIDKDDEGKDLEKPYSVWGFSLAGSKRMVKIQKNIETVSVTLEEDAKKWVYTVIVKDTKNGISLPGQADEFKKGENEKFARRTAMMKATRNAIISVADDDTKSEVFAEWYKKKYQKELNPSEILIVGEFAKLKDYK